MTSVAKAYGKEFVEKSRNNAIHFVLGGSRSGKSSYALNLAEGLGRDRTFIATCPAFDGELEKRIQKHRNERENRNWLTKEETIHISKAIREIHEEHVVLLDCMTLWISNLLFSDENSGSSFEDDAIFNLTEEFLEQSKKRKNDVIIVSNETGLGIVPDNALSRRFRDISGRCNQMIAAAADHVYFIAAGIPLKIK